ncbi:plasmid replication/partition related protein [Dyella sp. 2RAB6]|uniref:plasmid replication/partition related protein n=1 Tax=Dyella sp. 2RAB6 TaxID=3232992 RepID=UPI003F8F4124
MTDLVVNEELKAYIDPMTPDEYEALERSILAEGCRDALVLWGDTLVDGHHRYSVCRKHDLPFQTIQHARFQSMEDVHLWMIEQHLGRRSVSPFQRGVLALRKREILAARRGRSREVEEEAPPFEVDAVAEARADVVAVEAPATVPSREDLAREARLSHSQVGLIEKIQKQATEEVVAAVKSGVLSINAAAAVASLPAEEQRAAAEAGGKQLKEAAKRVREAKRKPRQKEREEAEGVAEPVEMSEREELLQLRQRVAELTAENQDLRQQLAQLQG